MEEAGMRRRWSWGLFAAAFASTLLLVYASLVPLNYRPLDWEETWRRWERVPWLKLGVYNRADWVANALVVIPSGFFATGAVWFATSRTWLRLAGGVATGLLLATLAFAIEFAQLWFPPRTVSQNDIFAGCIGAAAGPAMWFVFGPAAAWWSLRFLELPTIRERLRVLSLFAIAGSVLYSVFPLDMMVSAAEFRQKWEAGRIDLTLSPAGLSDSVAIKGFLLSILRMFPVGLWFGLWRCEDGKGILVRGSRDKGRVAMGIILAAVGFELIQVPIFSKYVSLHDILAGLLGGVVGWWVGMRPTILIRCLKSPWFWAAAWTGHAAFIFVAMLARHDSVVTDPDLLNERWQGMWTAPLLRYYYMSEYAALSNLAGKLGLFACLGVAVAGWQWSAGLRGRWVPFLVGLLLTGILGVAIELSQLYLLPLIGDATDVLIYMIGYSGGVGLAWLTLDGRSSWSTGYLLRRMT